MFQSIWRTEEAVRWSLRVCSRRSPWLQRCFRQTPSIIHGSFPRQHSWSTKQMQTGLCRGRTGPVQFYTQGGVHSEKEHPSPLESIQSGEITDLEPLKASFMEELERCCSLSDVLDLSNRRTLVAWQFSRCLSRMWDIYKNITIEQRCHEMQLLMENPVFEGLLGDIMKNVDNLCNEDLVFCLMPIIKLGVPQNSRVIQTLLGSCQEKMDNFDEQCLSVLASSLEHMDDCPRTNVLKEGLRLIIEARLSTVQKILPLQTMMRLFGKDTPLPLKQKLESKALRLSDQFTCVNSQSMLTIMAETGLSSKVLLDVCSSRITENVIRMPFSRISRVLHSCKELKYRDADMLNAFSDSIASMIDTIPTDKMIIILSAFEKLTFCPTEVMEAFAEKVIVNPENLTLRNLQCVLRVYSSLNYQLNQLRQPFLEVINRLLDLYLPEASHYNLINVAHSLALMDHFHSGVLEKLLQSSTLELFPTSGIKSCIGMFWALKMSLLLDRPVLPQQLSIPPAVLGTPLPLHRPDKPWLLKVLQNLLENHQDVVLQANVVVENFYVIDALITKPPLEQTEESSNRRVNYSPAESSQRIAVICSTQFCYGTNQPRGSLAVMMRHLKKLGYNTVLLNQHKLLPMPENKRLDLIRKRISL